MIVPIEQLSEHVRRTIVEVCSGVQAARKSGISSAEEPDNIAFQVQVVFKLNGAERVVAQEAGISIQTTEQLTDSVTTHGRTQREDRDNRGGSSQRETSTTETSGD